MFEVGALMKIDCLQIYNEVVVTGFIINNPRGGITNKGSFNLQFVIASPKGRVFDMTNCNYIPCIVWGDLAKKLELEKDDWVKITAKINTFKDKNENKFQLVVENLEVVHIV